VTADTGVTLDRRLGPLDAAAIVVSNVIGGGIFFVPILVAGLVPDARLMLLVWLTGGAFSFAGAMAYAELAALRPRAGGEYVYLREAFGPLVAFLSGWTSFVAGFSGAVAASAIALAEYLGRFVPGAGSATVLLALPLPLVPLTVTPKSLVAFAVIAVLSLAHASGLGPGRLVQNVLASGKIAALVFLIAAGFAVGRGEASAVVQPGTSTPTGFLLALIPVMFAYSGWNAASYVAEEVRNPGRNVPIALGAGTAAVIAIYMGLNALFLFALGPGNLAGVQSTLVDTVAERLFGFAAGNLVALFTLVSITASISAMVLAGPRVYFAMARDRVFAAWMGHVRARSRTPVRAIAAQAIWSGVLVLSGTLSQLVSYTGFAIVLFSGIAVSSVFVLRWRHPEAERPFRAWGYPFAPAIFVCASAVMVVNEMWRNPLPAAAGCAIIASGAPVYWWIRSRRGAGQGSFFSSPS
jgi:APA family basic amino acid/polyamine antiporter